MRSYGYHITIASHRSPEFINQTERWLREHGLVYDEIHLSFHKTQLINAKTDVVVDDAPQVLEKAVEHGAIATGLLFPWNRAYRDNGFRLCGNLNEILEGILPMNKEEFFDIVWRLEEILMEADYLKSQVGNCGGQCGIEDEGLCPKCCDALEKVIAEEKRLARNQELDDILKKLKRACDEDMTGEYERLLKQSREGKAIH